MIWEESDEIAVNLNVGIFVMFTSPEERNPFWKGRDLLQNVNGVIVVFTRILTLCGLFYQNPAWAMKT